MTALDSGLSLIMDDRDDFFLALLQWQIIGPLLPLLGEWPLGWFGSMDTGSQTESWLPPITTDGTTQTIAKIHSSGTQVGVTTCALEDASTQLSVTRPRVQSVTTQSTEPVLLPNASVYGSTPGDFLSLCVPQMPRSLREHFE